MFSVYPPSLDTTYNMAKLDKHTRDVDRLLEGVQERADPALGSLQELMKSVAKDQRN